MKNLALSAAALAALALLCNTLAFAQPDVRWDDDGWSRGDRRARVDGRDHRGPDRRDDREEVWRQHYARAYVYQDDPAYTECKKSSDPMGVIAGAVLGGILGNAVSHGDGGATVAGVVAGGAVGFGLTNKMKCEDRSYAYKTYNEGFNAGRRDAYYDWKNPRGGHGRFHVVDYYEDEDGFRCAVFEHTVWIDGRKERVHGRACQQPNGVWAIID